MPLWRGDGQELFYLSEENQIMAVSVKAGASSGPRPVFEAAPPAPLFTAALPRMVAGRNLCPYAVAADGKRFLVITTPADAETPLTMVVNWPAEVKR